MIEDDEAELRMSNSIKSVIETKVTNESKEKSKCVQNNGDSTMTALTKACVKVTEAVLRE